MVRLSKLLAAAWLALAVPVTAAAAPCAGFTDVDDSSGFCTSIAWMKNRAITLGCNVGGTLYCPNDFVRRDQMAAFMKRLGESLLPLTCAPGQLMKWNGADWACANDNTGAGGGGGTVSSVATGTGLQGSPNPITTTGSINLAPSYQLPQGCTNGQVAKSNGAGGWTCQPDAAGVGTVTSIVAGTGLTGGTITGSGTLAADTTYLQRRVSASCTAGSSIRAIAADGTVTCEVDDAGPANAFVQGGNAFGAPAVLGTTDNQPVDVIAKNERAARFEYAAVSPNVLLGHASAGTYTGVHGATIAGGGSTRTGASQCATGFGCVNSVTDHFGTVGGGEGNKAGDLDGDVTNSSHATVAGGFDNKAAGGFATVGGGVSNVTSSYYATTSGGLSNVAGGLGSTVAGGLYNKATGQGSFAAGVFANAAHDGCMVFGDDSTSNAVSCGATNQFVVRALGGIYVFTGGSTDATYTGAYVGPGQGAWSAYSDRDGKESLDAVDPVAIAHRLAALPMSTWQWKAEPNQVRHMGPMAQDFHAAFGLGASERHISTVDADGVALAAIQGVYKLVQQKDAEISALKREVADLRAIQQREVADLRATQQREVADLRQAVEILLARTSAEGNVAQAR